MLEYQVIIRRSIGEPMYVQFLSRRSAVKMAAKALKSLNVVSVVIHRWANLDSVW